MAGNGDSGNIYRLREDATTWQDDYHRLSERLTPLQVEYIRNIPDTFGKKQQYIELLLDDNYEDVQYNPENGGLKARHKNRGKYDSKGRKLELELMDYLYGLGHTVVLLGDRKEIDGDTAASLDMNLDGEPMDIRSKTQSIESNTIRNDLVDKNKQLKKYNSRIDIKVKGNSLCLYFPNKEYFEEKKITKGISDFLKLRGTKHIKYLKCVIDGKSEIVTYYLDDYKEI